LRDQRKALFINELEELRQSELRETKMTELKKSDTPNSDTAIAQVENKTQEAFRVQIAEQLRNLSRSVGGTAKLSEKTGIPKRTLDGYITNEAAIPGDRLSMILMVLNQIKPDAIDMFFHTLGAVMNVAPTIASTTTPRPSRSTFTVPRRDSETPRVEDERTPFGYVSIPLYRTPLSAGRGEVAISNEIVGTRLFDADWIKRTIGASSEMLSLWVNRGDSMQPTIHDGDMMLVDRSDTRPRKDDIYALLIDGEQYVKRLQRRLDGAIDVISDNPAYKTQTLTLNGDDQREVKIYGHIAWWAHTNRR